MKGDEARHQRRIGAGRQHHVVAGTHHDDVADALQVLLRKRTEPALRHRLVAGHHHRRRAENRAPRGQHVVERAIDELPEPFRLVFITRVIEGMNVEETAEILGLKPETVKTRLHRARNLLRDNVERKIGPVVMEAFPFAGKRCERLTEAVLKRLGYPA